MNILLGIVLLGAGYLLGRMRKEDREIEEVLQEDKVDLFDLILSEIQATTDEVVGTDEPIEDLEKKSSKSSFNVSITEKEITEYLKGFYYWVSYIPNSVGPSVLKYKEEDDAQTGINWNNAIGGSKIGIEGSGVIKARDEGKGFYFYNQKMGDETLFVLTPYGSDAYIERNYIFRSRTPVGTVKPGFVITENHDDYHLQVPGTELGNLTVYYCTDKGCTDLATDQSVITEYTVEILVDDILKFKETWTAGEEDFGRLRIFADGTETSPYRAYRPECFNPAFKVKVTSPQTGEYTQCGRMKLIDDGTLPAGSCGSC